MDSMLHKPPMQVAMTSRGKFPRESVYLHTRALWGLVFGGGIDVSERFLYREQQYGCKLIGIGRMGSDGGVFRHPRGTQWGFADRWAIKEGALSAGVKKA